MRKVKLSLFVLMVILFSIQTTSCVLAAEPIKGNFYWYGVKDTYGDNFGIRHAWTEEPQKPSKVYKPGDSGAVLRNNLNGYKVVSATWVGEKYYNEKRKRYQRKVEVIYEKGESNTQNPSDNKNKDNNPPEVSSIFPSSFPNVSISESDFISIKFKDEVKVPLAASGKPVKIFVGSNASGKEVNIKQVKKGNGNSDVDVYISNKLDVGTYTLVIDKTITNKNGIPMKEKYVQTYNVIKGGTSSNPPAQDPPKQDPPKQDPPAQDPPKQDPPVDSNAPATVAGYTFTSSELTIKFSKEIKRTDGLFEDPFIFFERTSDGKDHKWIFIKDFSKVSSDNMSIVFKYGSPISRDKRYGFSITGKIVTLSNNKPINDYRLIQRTDGGGGSGGGGGASRDF